MGIAQPGNFARCRDDGVEPFEYAIGIDGCQELL
jgi:hypothetical protein